MKTSKKRKVGGGELTVRRGHFYWNGNNITALWMDFFSGLSMEQEKDCVKLFTRKYAKLLKSLPSKVTKKK